MSLHTIIEPAGTLMTGWKLVPQPECRAADVRNDDDIPVEIACIPTAAENAPPVHPASRWELSSEKTARRSERKLGEVG
jgi:hypothetical protein